MIRKALKSDIPQIIQLMKSVPGMWDSRWRENTLELGIESSGGLSYVFEDEGRIVGFACAHDVGFRGYLSELVVSPETQGNGVGTKLVKRVEEDLGKRGCNVLFCDGWKAAEGFYKKLGWTEPDVVLLSKKL